MKEKMKEGERKLLVVGSEFKTLHKGRHFAGFPGDGQVFNPADFSEERLASMLGSGALKWEVIKIKTVTPVETKAGTSDGYPTPFEKE